MAKHYVVTVEFEGKPPEEIRVKAPNEAAARAVLRQALRELGHEDSKSAFTGTRDA